VVQSRRSRPGARGVAQQEPSTAADLEQSVARPELQSLEHRAAREVMDVVRAIHLEGTGTFRPPRDPVGQPLLELVAGLGTPLPGREILIAEAELAEELRLTAWPLGHPATLPLGAIEDPAGDEVEALGRQGVSTVEASMLQGGSRS
jgi:hypothetical protein